MSKFNQVDFLFTSSGDLDIDASGDLRTTEDTYGLAVLQEIKDRLKAIRGEWKLNERIGSNIESLLGEANTIENTEEIAAEVVRALTFDRFLSVNEIEVVPMVIAGYVLIIRIIIYTRGGVLNATVGYDSNQQRFIGY